MAFQDLVSISIFFTIISIMGGKSMMYSINGEFGQVRLCPDFIMEKQLPLPFRLESGGWHKCNEKYHIQRINGNGNGYMMFFHCSKGGVIKIGDVIYETVPGEMTILPPGVFHEYFTRTGEIWEFYWLHILGEAADAILEKLVEKCGYIQKVECVEKVFSLIESMLPEHFRQNSEYAIEISAAISQILHLLLQDIYQTAAPSNKKNRLISDVLFELETTYQQHLDLDELASSHYVSKAHLIRCFREETGYTPYDYLKRYRILKSCELLQYSSMNIQAIALEVGFSSLNNYIVQFRKEKGVTPGEYRKMKRL